MFTHPRVAAHGFGFFSDPAIYQRSLGIDVNLWWGLALLLFGMVMLFFGTARGWPSGSLKPWAPGPDGRQVQSRNPLETSRHAHGDAPTKGRKGKLQALGRQAIGTLYI